MKTLSIQKRVINSKRHTVGFLLTGNMRVSRSRAVSMAQRSKIAGVRVVNSRQGTYLQSTTGRRLYSLPTVAVK